jgi:zinc protease
VEVMNRAMNLAYAALLGNPDLVNTELEIIRNITTDDVTAAARRTIRTGGDSVLYYNRKN